MWGMRQKPEWEKELGGKEEEGNQFRQGTMEETRKKRLGVGGR